MTNYFFKPAACLALAFAILAPASLSADVHKRVPEMPENKAEQPFVDGLNKANGKHLRSERNFEVITKKAGFVPIGESSRYMKLRNVNETTKPESLVKKATRAAANEYIGNIYGVVSETKSGSYADAFWGKIDFEKSNITPIFRNTNLSNSGDIDHQTGAVRNGILYVPEGIRSSVRDFDVIWKRFDINTGEELASLNFGDNAQMWAQALCYDPVNDTFVGMAPNDDDPDNLVANRIVRYNPNKENFDPVIINDFGTGVGEIYSGFFFNPSDKQVYAFREDGRIDIIDRETGRFTQAAQVNCEDEDDDRILLAPYTDRGTTNLVYSPKDRLVYVTAPDFQNAGEIYLFYIDLDSGGYCERICQLDNDPHIATLFCSDGYALPEAAAEAEITEFSLVKDALSGSFTFKAPTTLFNNLKLEKNVTAIATIDGNEVYNATLAPGASASANFTVAEGKHTLEIHCDISPELPGPTTTYNFFAGNDTPKAPTNVAVNNDIISWTAPGAVGANNGYVDVDKLTYDVYIGNTKQNTEPVKGTSFQFKKPESLRQTEIKVNATANGKTSEFSDVIGAIIGNSLPLPYSATPTAAEASVFSVIDGNHDGSAFMFDREEGCFLLAVETYQSTNDWLIMPLLNFDDASKMYKLNVTYLHQTPYYGTENIGIYIGKDPEHLDTQIAYFPAISVSDHEFPMSIDFSVPEAGDYYIGFNARTDEESSGSRFCNINVEKLNSTTGVPVAVSDAELVPDAKGDNKLTINVTVPSKSVDGKALDASKNVTVHAVNTAPTADFSASVSGKPGEKVSIAVDALKGFNTYRIYASNDAGDGPSFFGRKYIGLDTPVLPVNIKHETCEDNMSMNISWDPVTEGINGGFIDPETVQYQIFYRSSAVRWNAAVNPFSQTAVNYNPNYPDLARWDLCVLARNRDGDLLKPQTVNSFGDQLGTPITLPLVEDFAITGLKYPWSYDRTADNATEFCSFATYSTSDLPILGVGSPTTDDGSCRVLSSLVYGAGCEAHLYVPKFSTISMDNPVFLMRIWNYEYAPRFEVYARCFGQEEAEKIGECAPGDYENFAWRDYTLELPEKYRNKSWVQLQIHFWLPSVGSAYGIIDKIQVYANVDHDYKIDAITGPESTTVGEVGNFRITATNGGLENGNANVRVSLYGDGKYLDCRDFTLRNFRSLRTLTRQVSFDATTELTKYDNLEVRATITGEGDKIADNDTKSFTWVVNKKNVPTVNDLSGSWNDTHDAPTLSWTMPDLNYGNHEDFEHLPAWSVDEELGQWFNYDEDQLPTFAVSGLADTWPNAGDPKGWQVVDAEELGMTNDPDLCAHSGKKYLAAFAGYIPESSANVQVADWLISPEVVGGTEVTFWMNNISKDYRETLHIMVSSTDDNLESFTKLCNRSKEGIDHWAQGAFTLPADTKYFAFKYVGYNTLGVLLDDIEFTPVNISQWSIDGFDIYRRYDNEDTFTKIGTTKDLSFLDETCGDNNVNYYIVARSSLDGVSVSSPRSNTVRLFSLGVDEIAAVEGISGSEGAIDFNGLSGKVAAIYGTDGKLVKSAAIDSDNFSTPIEAGIYIVKVGKIAAKVVVK